MPRAVQGACYRMLTVQDSVWLRGPETQRLRNVSAKQWGAPICVCPADRTAQLVSRGTLQGLQQCPPVGGGLPCSFQGSPVPSAAHLLVVNWP